MLNDEFILGQGLGHQLELAFRRNGWTTADVHTLCGGDLLGRLRKQMLKPAEPVVSLQGTLDRNPLFKVWKTITIGTRTAEEIIQALLDEHYRVDENSLKVLRASTFETAPTQVNLAILSHTDLGYDNGKLPHFSVICRRIQRLGFELCTPEMAAELRLLNYDDQEEFPDTYVAMRAIEGLVMYHYQSEDYGTLNLSASDINGASDYETMSYICVIP